MKMSSKPKAGEFQAASAQLTSEETRAQDLFNKQKAYFASDATKAYEWRVDQLNRLTRMLKENFERFANASRKDFKTASQENVFEVSASIATSEFAKSQVKEWMRPVEAPLPKFLAKSGHKGMVYREPYGVTLIICPFNGPLGKYGYDSLTHAKPVLISPPDVAIDHLFPPYTKEKVEALNQWFDY
jgi:acyl-CoA reductase-like NAD-dependent aldehyde dehydrogenase